MALYDCGVTRFEEDETDEGYCALFSSDDAALVERFTGWCRSYEVAYETVTSARGDGAPDVITERITDPRLAKLLRMAWKAA